MDGPGWASSFILPCPKQPSPTLVRATLIEANCCHHTNEMTLPGNFACPQKKEVLLVGYYSNPGKKSVQAVILFMNMFMNMRATMRTMMAAKE